MIDINAIFKLVWLNFNTNILRVQYYENKIEIFSIKLCSTILMIIQW